MCVQKWMPEALLRAVSASQRLQITLEFPRPAAFRFGSFGSGITLFASEKALGVVFRFLELDTARRRYCPSSTPKGHDLRRVVCRRLTGTLGECAPRTWPAAYEAALRLRVPARIDRSVDHRDSVDVHRSAPE